MHAILTDMFLWQEMVQKHMGNRTQPHSMWPKATCKAASFQ